jgi:hypothetical protein
VTCAARIARDLCGIVLQLDWEDNAVVKRGRAVLAELICARPRVISPSKKRPAPAADRLNRERLMSSFDDREQAFERKFAHDEELRFRAMARRNKLLGLWAAEKMGITGDDAEVYAKEVVKADFEEKGDEDVFRKIRRDFDEKGVDQSDHQIRRTMVELLDEAVKQIESERG